MNLTHLLPKTLHLMLVCFAALCLSACGDDDSSSGGDASSSSSGGDASSSSSSGGDASSSSSGGDASSSGGGVTDITDAVFTATDPSCGAYAGEYEAMVDDVGRGTSFTCSVTITADGGDCTITSNSIPNHDFNEMGAFATPVSELTETYNIPGAPVAAASATALSLEYDNAIFLNGVKLDLLAAACYGVGNEPLGQEKIGCMGESPWRYDPMFSGNSFGTDEHNAHTQPDGAYHYHGDPKGMYDNAGGAVSGVIGFAADGFPIFGPFFDDNGTIRRATSGYALKSGARVSQAGEGAFPGGDHDGTYVDDYEWSAGNGECNGMTVNGVYGYYLTETYPWVLRCFTGAPDPTFRKMMMP